MGFSDSASRRSLFSRVARTVGAAGLAVAALTVGAEAAGRHAAFVIDANTGKVLHSDDADEHRYPASLTKMMTLYLLFEAIESGKVSMATTMKVSTYASARPPSKIGLKPGATIGVEDAIMSLVTRSANDISVVIAEHLGGSEGRFAQMMTAKARQLGMSRTTFRNANGLPNEGQRTTARDMATLGIALREHFPREYRYFSRKSFNFRGRTIGNHNRLLGRIKGVDGIKTGYINASGFNLVSSVTDGNRRLVGVVFGGNTGASRDNEMAKLLNKYLPQASSRSSGAPLVAEKKRGSRVVPEPQLAAFAAPTRDVPLPTFSSRKLSINERIAEAYGSAAGDAVARTGKTRSRPVVGRDAIRAALAQPTPSLLRPAAAPSAAAYGGETRMQPRGVIPGGPDRDPLTTGSIAAAIVSNPASAWVVQIAATADRVQAMQMLGAAKAKGGSPLAGASAFTQPVGSGSQTLYRARFAGFDTKAAANQACDALKRHSYKCFAIAN